MLFAKSDEYVSSIASYMIVNAWTGRALYKLLALVLDVPPIEQEKVANDCSLHICDLGKTTVPKQDSDTETSPPISIKQVGSSIYVG